jgi:DNA repair exonuclease SbcCD ATPase subunit
MRLKKIDIVKFRNLSNVSFEIPEGKKAIVFSGLNGIGKTTVIDSVMWLLCDETLVYGKENSDNLDKNNRQDTVEVTCLFVKDNGDELELKRKLYPKYNKAGEFSSYANEFYINGADYSPKKYFARLLNEELGVRLENDPDVTGFNTLRSIIDYNYILSAKIIILLSILQIG